MKNSKEFAIETVTRDVDLLEIVYERMKNYKEIVLATIE